MLLNARQIHQRLKGVNLILVAFEDITERKKAELVVFEAREYAQNIMATMRESLLVLDDNLRVISANDSFYKTFEVTSKETEGNCIFDLGNSQWDIPKLHELLEKIIPEKSFFADFEVEHVFPKIGSKIMLLNARQIHQRLKGANLILVAFEDITERKKAEEKMQESRDRMDRINEKLQVVGHLTRHDALNKITAIDGQTFLLNEKYADHMEIANRLGKIQQACNAIKAIFGFAKIYEQIGIGELTFIDVEEKLNEAVAIFPGAILKINNECHGLTVLADSSLMQLFYNLIDNTIKHGKKTTTIRVHYEKVDQANLKLVYEDDGVGVPLEDKPKLFTEGFSTSDSTGFGLFLTKKMIQVYGWTISEEGEPGKGAKFVITIPSSSVSILNRKSHIK
jgi:PAS domain S-box-containing protein